ncbi:MAG: penicillin-binding protein activator [Pseudomonadota bacterium]|nr:penicillin-binding protein activator [Pseudomonadota bacterium]
MKARDALRRRKSAKLWAGICLAALLSGCNSSGFGGFTENTPAPTPKIDAPTLAAPGAPVGQTYGTGPVRVGMILPLTQNGAPSGIGQALSNAAEMAVLDGGAGDITLMLLDDRSSPEAAGSAAQAEVKAGAEIILGPLFAADVRQASGVAKPAGVPMIAFSTDSTTASDNVYLLSFLVESYVDRIVDFANSKGKKTFAILAPQNDYANVAANEFKAEAARVGANVVTVVRYAPGQAAAAAAQLMKDAPNVDAVFLPEQADALGGVASSLASAGLKTQLLGTGVWNDPRVAAIPALQGAWYSTPENSGFAAFAKRYRAKYNAEPPRLATLSYDAVSLVAALAHSGNGQRFKPSVLANASGFNGADGVFRFRASGLNERGLAVVQIGNGGVEVISPAPKSFAGG